MCTRAYIPLALGYSYAFNFNGAQCEARNRILHWITYTQLVIVLPVDFAYVNCEWRMWMWVIVYANRYVKVVTYVFFLLLRLCVVLLLLLSQMMSAQAKFIGRMQYITDMLHSVEKNNSMSCRIETQSESEREREQEGATVFFDACLWLWNSV